MSEEVCHHILHTLLFNAYFQDAFTCDRHKRDKHMEYFCV